MRKLSSLFLAGLATLLPVVICFYITWWLFTTIDGWLAPILKRLGYYFPGIGFALTIILILFIGFMATNVFGKKLIGLGEKALLKTPVLGKMYATAKRILDSFLKPNKNSFSQVVLVEFPRKGLHSLGFITNENFGYLDESNYCVFIPTTPNPTTGFFVICSQEQVKILDISVEKGMEILISAGMITDK